MILLSAPALSFSYQTREGHYRLFFWLLSPGPLHCSWHGDENLKENPDQEEPPHHLLGLTRVLIIFRWQITICT